MPLKKLSSGASASKQKQTILVTLLAFVLVAVGFWQWQSLSAGETPPQKQTKPQTSQPTQQEAKTDTTNPTDASSGQVATASTSPRDPFRPFEISSESSSPTQGGTKVVADRPRTNREIQGNPPPPPVLPMGIPAGNNLQLRPDGTLGDAPNNALPSWTVTGVVQGPASVAIVKDSEGNRRFVKPGDPLEEGWRVQRIERGQITLVKGKETIVIRVGQSSQASGGN
ncbi:MAG: HofP DNA utilization family protein [Fimbriimonadales bacterium]